MTQSFADKLINDEVLLPRGEGTVLAKVMRQLVDANGKVVGTYNDCSMLNTLVYDCEFPDGTTKEYTANIIAENILIESDLQGHTKQMLMGIVDHKRNGDAISKRNMHIKSKSGQNRIRQTMVGWKLLVQWDNGTRQWMDLKLMKESNPVQVAEYAESRGISDEPAFAWWVPYTLRKKDIIVSAITHVSAVKPTSMG